MNKEVKELLTWIPESVDLKAISKINYQPSLGVYASGDEKCPFFSEAYLYNLLGKQDARTLMCLIKRALLSLGVSEKELDKGDML